MPVAFRVVFTRAARAELIEAQDWYEGEAPEFGSRFRAVIDAGVERMMANPLQFPIVHRNVRRVLVRRFPYMLLFIIKDSSLVVIACFHASRDPRQWKKRM